MSTATYISSASKQKKNIVFIYHNFKAGKQSFSTFIASPPIGLKKFCPELRKNAVLISQSYHSQPREFRTLHCFWGFSLIGIFRVKCSLRQLIFSYTKSAQVHRGVFPCKNFEMLNGKNGTFLRP